MRGAKPIDLSGHVYGRLTVLRIHSRNLHGQIMWLCRCSCGSEKPILANSLRQKRRPTLSCGCLAREINSSRHISHGLSKSHPLYKTWLGMRNRCGNENRPVWYKYGGRGIQVCQEWSDFTVFLADMGERPEGHSLDRIDNDQGYSAANCRWATDKEQANNKRKAGTALRDYLNYQTGLQFIAALLGPTLRISA